MKNILILCVAILIFSIPAVAQTVQVGDEAPQFAGTTFYGNNFSLHDTAEDSIVVIYFMGYS